METKVSDSPAWIAQIAHTIEHIDDKGFFAALSAMLRAVVPYSYTVVFAYRDQEQPLDLFDDFPAAKRRIFVTDYQAGPYLLDPFYLGSRKPLPAGLFRLKDVAPDRFYQGEYFRNYYVRTGLAEEIGYFTNLPDGIMVVLSLMRAESPFTTREFRLLSAAQPVVSALLRRHLADLPQRMQSDQRPDRPTEIDQAFQNFGGTLLTPREREVVEFTLKGHSAEAIGGILTIAPGTVRIHRRNIYAKLRINSQGELFSRFIHTLAAPKR